MILGIDIGVSGALALLDFKGELIDVYDMPCLLDGVRTKAGKNRRTVNAPLLAELIYKTHATKAFVERVGPMPKEGAVSAFAFGDCKGVVRGVLAAAAIPVLFITPPQWKRAVGIPPGKLGAKDAARSEALRRWPAHAARFKLKKDDGKAEACLIGLAGILAFSSVIELAPSNTVAAGRA